MKKLKKNLNYKIVSALILFFLFSFFMGFEFGTYITIKSVAKVASGFMDKGIVEQAIFHYKNNIGECFPSKF